MGEVRSSTEFVRHLIVELSCFTGMRGAVVRQALYDAGFPDGHLPSRREADLLTGELVAVGWKALLTRHELDVAMAVLFLRTRYSNGRPGGLLLMWHPTTRWLFVRVTGARKAAEPDFHRWIDRRLLEGATRFARIRTMVDQQKKQAAGLKRKVAQKRSGHLPKADLEHLPKIVILGDFLHNDGYEPNFVDWNLEPRILPQSDVINNRSYIYDLSDLPTSRDPHAFIQHIVNGYNFAEGFFAIGRRGSRIRLANPRSSIPMRLGIDGNKGRRWRDLVRMPVFGEGRTKRGPFEHSRQGLTRE